MDNSRSPFSYILVIKELWLGFITLVPLCQTTTEAIAQTIYSDIILPFGNFKNLCSDNAANFSTLAVKEICHLLSIKTRKSLAYHPASNGKIERTMAVIGGYKRLGPSVEDYRFEHKFEPTGPYTVQSIFPPAFLRVPFLLCFCRFHRWCSIK